MGWRNRIGKTAYDLYWPHRELSGAWNRGIRETQPLSIFTFSKSGNKQIAQYPSFPERPNSNNLKLLDQFGNNKPYLRNKNIGSIFKSKPAPFVAQSPFVSKVRTVFNKKFQEYIRGKHILTTISEINTEGDKLIVAAK